jgi:class 3 adenylate cyclase
MSENEQGKTSKEKKIVKGLAPDQEKTIGIGSVKEEEEIRTSLVQAVVMFADIRQFSEWVKEGQSPEIVGDFLRRCYLLFRKVLWEHENPFVKLLGDGVFACWEMGKGAAEAPDLTRRYKQIALEAAFEIVESYPFIEDDLGRPIASGLGVGIAEDFITKLTITAGGKEQFDYVGYAVNLVAHIQGVAYAGQVLVHDHFRKGLDSSDYSFREIPEKELLQLKGIYESERTRIFHVQRNK